MALYAKLEPYKHVTANKKRPMATNHMGDEDSHNQFNETAPKS